MKRLLAVLLILATLISLGITVPGSADKYAEAPFYLVNWMGPRYVDFPENVAEMLKPELTAITKDDTKITINMFDTTDIPAMAKKLKEAFNSRPKGTRYLNFPMAIEKQVEHMIYMDKTVAMFKAWIIEFFTEYKRIGGKIDGLILDMEYPVAGAYYINSLYEKSITIKDELKGTSVTIPQNKEIYNNIVNDSRYATEVRPYLEERGFQFATPNGDQSEIYPISDSTSTEYAIWNAVMHNRICKYLNEACAPFVELYPEADVSNYRFAGNNVWNESSDDWGKAYNGGNTGYAGNAANENFFLSRPYETVQDTSNGYITPITYNGAVYEDTSFNAFLSEVNTFKDMYASSDNKRISAWITGFNYLSTGERTESGLAYSPYYAEMLFHIGLLDPQPFIGYIVAPRDTDGNEDPYDYSDVMRNVSEILEELTRVAGYADRKPISVPKTWNSNFVISGMYAGGRNIWRITPNTSDGMTVAEFKVKDQAPTFRIAGEIVTFPQGKILEESKIYATGTCGYWIETPADVTPVVITDTDRYEKYPAYEENFDTYEVGATFSATTVRHTDAWTFDGAAATIQSNNGSKALELTGTATITNTKIPMNVTAGDSYAKQQVWEVTVTVPGSGELKVLSCSENDSGIRIAGGKVYYDGDTELASVEAGKTYVISREVDFRNESAFTSTYTVKTADGKMVAQKKDVAMEQVSIPVKNITISCTDVDKAYMDNYRLQATGVTTELKLYEANTGMRIADATAAREKDTVYRLSWMNASRDYQVAKIYNDGTLIKTVEMPSGADGYITDLVEGNSLLTVTVEKGKAPQYPDYDKDDFYWTPEETVLPETTTPPETEEATTPSTEEMTVPPTTDSTAPTEGTTETTAPVDPTEGITDPTESTAPVDPTEGTTDPTESTAPVDPTEGTKEPTTPVTTPVAPTAPVEDAKGISGGKVILIVICAVLVLACGGFALCWFVIKPKWLMDIEFNKSTCQKCLALIKSKWRMVLEFIKSKK